MQDIGYIQNRRVTVGELLSGTYAHIAGIKKELAIYFGAFFIAGLAAELIEAGRGVISFAAFFGYFVGQYYLYRAALRRAGVDCDSEFKVFSLFSMAIILAVPIAIGFQLFFIPGILLASKYIMAPAFLVAEKGNFIGAIGASWRASSGNTLALAAVFTVILIVWVFAYSFSVSALGGVGALRILEGLGSSAALDGAEGSALSALGWLVFHTFPVTLMGVSISAYRALSERENDYAKVFE